MEKLSDYQMLQMAYDYQHNKDDFINATIWLHRLLMEYPDSEYIDVAKKRIAEMGIPLEIAKREIGNIESAKNDELNKLKQNIPDTLIELVKKYEGKIVKINYKEPFNFENAFLIKISKDFITILFNNIICHYPFNYIMAVGERKDPGGQDIIVLQVYHQIPITQGAGGPVIGVGAIFDLSSIFS